MIKRLSHLSVCIPAPTDALAIATVVHLCASSEIDSVYTAENDVRKRWRTPSFSLTDDARVVVTRTGGIVGYADVVRHSRMQSETAVVAFVANMYVHPEYRGQGIEAALIGFVEGRACQLARAEFAWQQVVLRVMVSSLDTDTHTIFQHGGYMSVRRIWRVSIQIEDTPASSFESGQLNVDLILDNDDLLDTNQQLLRTGIYNACQYDVYEKALCGTEEDTDETAHDMQYVGK